MQPTHICDKYSRGARAYTRAFDSPIMVLVIYLLPSYIQPTRSYISCSRSLVWVPLSKMYACRSERLSVSYAFKYLMSNIHLRLSSYYEAINHII